MQTQEITGLSASEQFSRAVHEILARIAATQGNAIEEAARLVADTIGRGGLVYAFGSGHSQSVAHEFYYRAGGLAPCDVIQEKTFGRAERLSGYAAPLLDSYPISATDLLVVISNSGRNPLPVEIAQAAAERGLKVVAITSLAHSRSVAPRLAGGKRLFEICDVVVDNCCVGGDAMVDLAGGIRVGAASTLAGGIRVGAASTLAGAFIAQSIVCAAAEELLRRGIHPPVYLSMNLDGADQRNRDLIESNRLRIRGL